RSSAPSPIPRDGPHPSCPTISGRGGDRADSRSIGAAAFQTEGGLVVWLVSGRNGGELSPAGGATPAAAAWRGRPPRRAGRGAPGGRAAAVGRPGGWFHGGHRCPRRTSARTTSARRCLVSP